MTRLEELRAKFRPVIPQESILTDDSDLRFFHEEAEKRVEDHNRWHQLTKFWSNEDRDWAWRYIAGCSQPRA